MIKQYQSNQEVIQNKMLELQKLQQPKENVNWGHVGNQIEIIKLLDQAIEWSR